MNHAYERVLRTRRIKAARRLFERNAACEPCSVLEAGDAYSAMLRATKGLGPLASQADRRFRAWLDRGLGAGEQPPPEDLERLRTDVNG